jgi:hypothetical protein
MEAPMFGRNRILVAVAAALAIVSFAPGCNSNIDSASGPDVVMLVENMNIPPVTAATDATSGACTFTITNANATFKNKPKNSLASTSPFNDIVLQDVTVYYDWGGSSGATGTPSVFGVGGSVPADGSSTAQFAVADVAAVLGHAGETAAMTMTFHGNTVAGDAVSVTTGGSLIVNNCGM